MESYRILRLYYSWRFKIANHALVRYHRLWRDTFTADEWNKA
jgi:hypothetical protein